MKQLPISQSKQEIQKSVVAFDITIILTPTGSGKTLAIPKYIHELFGGRLYCTVPRVPIAKRSAKSANEIVWANTDFSAGFITGRGSNVPKNAAVVYATEGSVLNMIAGGMKPHILMLDEAHEQGVLMEALLRKSKDIVKDGGKVVIASATIDAPRYKGYYEKNGISVNIVELPKTERPFSQHFVRLQSDETPAKMIVGMANKGHRCLVGVSGKKEIDEFIMYLKSAGCKVPIFPFHGELEEEEQDEIDKCKGAMVIVSTNILQSGVTLPQVSVGYFEGYGKAMFREHGVNVLKEYLLSKAEMEQWFGRLGRTCDGLIFLSENDFMRSEMPIPEIKRVALEDAVLTLANVGIDIYNADLLNQPTEEAIEEAVTNLRALGLLNDDATITDLGRKVLFSGNGIRAGIITVLGMQMGVSNTAEKVAAIINIGTPFRRSNFRKEWYNEESKQSDLLIWKDVIDWFSDNYTYKGRVEFHKADEFKQLCEEKNIFRRSLKKLMSKFSNIDDSCMDITPDVVSTIVKIIFEAYADQIDYEFDISDAKDSIANGKGERTGNVLSIGRATFFEHVTYKEKR